MVTLRAPLADAQRKAELAAIHVCRQQLCLDEEVYRDLLEQLTGKRSAADLDGPQRRTVLDHMRQRGARKPAFGRLGGAARRVLAGGGDRRPQHAKIVALWRALHNLGAVTDGSELALDAWLKRTCSVDALRFCTARHSNQAIEGLKSWCSREGFDEPDEARRAVLHAARKHAGLQHEPAVPIKAVLIEAQWRRLNALGRLRAGIFANLGTWLQREAGVAAPHFLTAGEADRCIERLGDWIRRGE